MLVYRRVSGTYFASKSSYIFPGFFYRERIGIGWDFCSPKNICRDNNRKNPAVLYLRENSFTFGSGCIFKISFHYEKTALYYYSIRIPVFDNSKKANICAMRHLVITGNFIHPEQYSTPKVGRYTPVLSNSRVITPLKKWFSQPQVHIYIIYIYINCPFITVIKQLYLSQSPRLAHQFFPAANQVAPARRC